MASGDVIENPAARMELRLLRTAADTGGELLEMEATYQPGSAEPLEHYHPRQDEHFEILVGTMTARVDGEDRTLSPGAGIDIPAGTVHAMWNGGEEEARVMWQTRPALQTEEFFRTIARMAGEGKLTPEGARNPLVGAALMQEFREEFRPTNPPGAVQSVAFPLLALVARALGQRP